MDFTDAFDKRLESIRRGRAMGSTLAAASEIDAAIVIYERLKTAQAICTAMQPNATPSEIVALAIEIGAEARHRQSSTGYE